MMSSASCRHSNGTNVIVHRHISTHLPFTIIEAVEEVEEVEVVVVVGVGE